MVGITQGNSSGRGIAGRGGMEELSGQGFSKGPWSSLVV